MLDEKIMFQIYWDRTYSQEYRVVYFTELTEQNRDQEINRALMGSTYYSGFIRSVHGEEAKQVIENHLHQLNEGASVGVQELEKLLADYLVP